ncbi:MAG: thioesterase domain-containing protein, partial [Archangium sp.]
QAATRTSRVEPRPASRPPPPAKTARKGGPAVPARNATEQVLVELFRELFHIEEIGIHDDFFALGGDSLMGLKLTGQIGQRFGVKLPLKALVEAPTIAALAEKVGGTRETVAPTRSGCLVQLQEGSGPALFFPHAVGGQALFYKDLARLIAPTRPAYGFESPALEEGGVELTTVEEMAEHYLEALRSVQPAGPYLLVGASFGGILAYEMGRRLSAEGHAVPLCALLDSPGPGRLPTPFEDDAEILSNLVKHWVDIPPGTLRGLSLDAQLQRVIDEATRASLELFFTDVERGRRLLRVWKANVNAMYRYTAPRWEGGELQFFRALELQPRMPDHLEQAWIDLCSAVRIEVVPGDHLTMMLPPHVEGLAARIRSFLERSHVD